MRKNQLKILDAAQEILAHPLTPEDEKAFIARQLVQVTLPHSDPGNIPIWTRANGDLTLAIRPGWDFKNNQSLGYPCGTIPRLLLFWITTEALRSGNRKLILGDTLAGFMRELELDPQRGGPRSDAARLKKQMERLFKATISFEYRQRQNTIEKTRWLDMQIAPEGELWWDLSQPEQGALFGSWIELGEKFHQAIMASPVPVDMRALRALKHSPLALDLYAWSTYRVFTVTQKGKPQFISWRGMQEQLGADYSDIKNFYRKIKEAFRGRLKSRIVSKKAHTV